MNRIIPSTHSQNYTQLIELHQINRITPNSSNRIIPNTQCQNSVEHHKTLNLIAEQLTILGGWNLPFSPWQLPDILPGAADHGGGRAEARVLPRDPPAHRPLHVPHLASQEWAAEGQEGHQPPAPRGRAGLQPAGECGTGQSLPWAGLWLGSWGRESPAFLPKSVLVSVAQLQSLPWTVQLSFPKPRESPVSLSKVSTSGCGTAPGPHLGLDLSQDPEIHLGWQDKSSFSPQSQRRVQLSFPKTRESPAFLPKVSASYCSAPRIISRHNQKEMSGLSQCRAVSPLKIFIVLHHQLSC